MDLRWLRRVPVIVDRQDALHLASSASLWRARRVRSLCPVFSGSSRTSKGKAKEVVGTVAGHDDLKEEGQAQQDKAEAQRDVAKKEAEAEAARGAEKAAAARQKAAE